MASTLDIIIRARDRASAALQKVKAELGGLSKVSQRMFGLGNLESVGKLGAAALLVRGLLRNMQEYARIARETGDRRIVNDADLRALDSIGGKWRDIKSTVASITAQFTSWLSMGLDKIGLGGSMTEAEDYLDAAMSNQEKNSQAIKARIEEIRKARQDANEAERKLNEGRMTDEQLLGERKKDLTTVFTEKPKTRLEEALNEKRRFELLLEIQKLEDKIAKDRSAEDEKRKKAKSELDELTADQAKEKRKSDASATIERLRERGLGNQSLQSSIATGAARVVDEKTASGISNRISALGMVASGNEDWKQNARIEGYLKTISENLTVPK